MVAKGNKVAFMILDPSGTEHRMDRGNDSYIVLQPKGEYLINLDSYGRNNNYSR